MSGYTHCACRDCMDVAISRDPSKPELCLLCKGADCLPCFAQEADRVCGSAHECQREDAYGDDVADAGTGHGAYEYRSGH